MTPKDSLFRLIKSLNSNEKRYFRLNQIHSGNKSYLRVFDEISKMKIYDEKALKEKLSGLNCIKQLTFTKNYLFNSILNSLVNYNHNSSVDIRLRFDLSKAKILFDKSMYGDYFEEIRRIKNKAYKHERFEILLEVISMERVYINVLKQKKKRLTNLYVEEKNVIQKIDNLSLYSKLIRETYLIFRDDGISRNKSTIEKLKQIKSNPLAKSESSALSIKAKEYYFHLNQLISEISGNVENEFDFTMRRFKLASDHPHIFSSMLTNPRQEALIKLILLSAHSNKADLKKDFFAKLITSSARGKSIDEYVILFLEMYIMIVNRKFEANKSFQKKIKDSIQSNKKIMEKDFYLFYNFKYCEWLLLCGRVEDALRAVNELMSDPLLKNREDLKLFTSVLNVMVHIDLENYLLVESLCSSMNKSLRNKSKLYKFEQGFIKFAIRLSKASSKKEVKEEKNIYTAKLNKISKSGDIFFRNALSYLDLVYWLGK